MHKQLLQQIYDNYAHGTSKTAAHELMGAIEFLASEQSFLAINALLHEIEFTKTGPHSAVALIKSMHRLSEKFSNYQDAKQRAIHYLSSIGHDGHMLLKTY